MVAEMVTEPGITTDGAARSPTLLKFSNTVQLTALMRLFQEQKERMKAGARRWTAVW